MYKKLDSKNFLNFIMKNNYNFLIIFISLFASALCSFLLNIIIARNFSQEIFGSFSSSLYIATMFSAFALMGIDGFLLNIHAKEKKFFNNNLIRVSILLAFSFFITLCTYIFVIFYAPHSDLTKNFMLLLFFFVIGNAITDLVKSIYQIEYNYLKLSILNFLPQLLRLILVIIIFLIFKIKDELYLGYIFLFLSLSLIFFYNKKIFLFFYNKKINKLQTLNFNEIKKVFSKTFFYNSGKVLAYIYLSLEIVYIKYILDDKSVAIFNAAYIIILGTFLISDAYSKLFMHTYYKLSKNNIYLLKKIFFNGSFFLLLCSFFVVSVFFTFSEQIIYLFYGEKFSSSSKFLYYLSVLVPIRYLVTNTTMLLRVQNYAQYETNSLLNVLIFKIIICFFCISYFGLFGAVISIISGEVYFLILTIIYILKKKILIKKNFI